MERLSNDLFRLISLESCRSRVVRCDSALLVEHIDGVILHGFDGQSKSIFAFSQCLLGFALARHIMCHSDETLQPVCLMNGCQDPVRAESRAVLADRPGLVL